MMLKETLNLLDSSDPRCTSWTTQHPNATIFHHPAWIEMLGTCYGYPSKMAVIFGVDNQPVAALPLMKVSSWITGKRMVAVPFSDFCQPLTINDNHLYPLVNGLQSLRRQIKIPEIRVHWPLPQSDGVYPANTFFRHITHLEPDSRQVNKSFSKTQVQQRIRKAEREGLQIQKHTDWDAVLKFYSLHVKTRRRLGSPVQSLRFFRLVWEKIINQGLGFVLLAYQGSQLIAGSVFFNFNKTLTYKYSASEPTFWHLRPNNLILWRAIQWGCQNGYEVFDWGRTDPDNEGLREFKLGWGCEEEIVQYSILADHEPKKNVNVSPSRCLTSLIQHSPIWVCRLIGELFYGHFGS